MIQSVSDTQNMFQANSVQQKQVTTKSEQPTFSDFLKRSINELNTQKVTSDQLTEALANGADVELHQVYIAAQKASVSMSAALEFRNKVIETYQEVMRMSV